MHALGRERACERLSASHGLTAREAEVLLMISEGNSKQAIADKLVVTLSTVQAHSKTIYRKLAVHSRQEVINLVNAACKGESAR